MAGAGAERSDDERFMLATLAYGRRGLGTTAPNPCVAALVVGDGVVLGRGVTAPGGRPHAEPIALAAAGASARGATLYVTLEPCSHYGRTAPCTEAIIAAGVARVVVGAGDPDPRVSGRGIAQLRGAGLDVVTGICAEQAGRDHVGHVRRVTEGRPAVTLKLAETADGFAAGPPGTARLMITGEVANAWTQVSRAAHDAVMVGAGTARADDPALTVRLPGMGERQPARVVLDARASLPLDGRLVASAGRVPLSVLVGPATDPTRIEALRAAGVRVAAVPSGPAGLDLPAALRTLGSDGITRIFCEGGPRLGAALLAAGLLDEVAILTGRQTVGEGLLALDAAARQVLDTTFHLVEDRPLGPDRLRRYERI